MYSQIKQKPALVIHGGAWEIPDEEIENHINGLAEALSQGWHLLKKGRSALDVVEETVALLEDDPTFDAGRGSVLNTDGSIEMDASIMDGLSLDAGAVAALRNFPNPVRIARCVLDKTEHILLAGKGCEEFAKQEGFTQVPIEQLLTNRELERLKRLILDHRFRTPHAFGGKHGTVGAVAMDNYGSIAAATSTGGSPRKIPGRVGDSPLIGCGTYADNQIGGVSCTGWGESIIKVMLAKVVVDFMNEGHDAQSAADKGINHLKVKVEGLGGIICIDHQGQVGICYNTPRMARGYMVKGLKHPEVEVL
jgi:beta-aspartyl-peptidase (threonine type)